MRYCIFGDIHGNLHALDAMLEDCKGREIVATSLLGPFFGVTVFAEEDPSVAEKYFATRQTQSAARALAQQLQQDLQFQRVSLHKLTHALLVNSTTRECTLNYLSAVINRNAKRQQMHVNERQVAGDGFMLNVLSVMQQLASKVKLDKIDGNILR